MLKIRALARVSKYDIKAWLMGRGCQGWFYWWGGQMCPQFVETNVTKLIFTIRHIQLSYQEPDGKILRMALLILYQDTFKYVYWVSCIYRTYTIFQGLVPSGLHVRCKYKICLVFCKFVLYKDKWLFSWFWNNG